MSKYKAKKVREIGLKSAIPLKASEVLFKAMYSKLRVFTRICLKLHLISHSVKLF